MAFFQVVMAVCDGCRGESLLKVIPTSKGLADITLPMGWQNRKTLNASGQPRLICGACVSAELPAEEHA